MADELTDNELNNELNNDSIESQAESAAGSTAEDTLDEYKKLLNEMKEQNKALIEQNKSLQSQFSVLIRNGASVSRETSTEPEPKSEPEHYVSLAELGAEIGKRDYKSHNSKKE